MRGWTALGVVALAAALAAGSEVLVRLDGPLYTGFIVYTLVILAAGALAGLLYLYLQIRVGPHATADRQDRAEARERCTYARAGPRAPTANAASRSWSSRLAFWPT